MRLGSEEAHVQVTASREAYTDGSTGPDVVASIEVRIDNFSAGVVGIVARGDWVGFLAELSELEKARRGQAVLRSADGALDFRIYAVDGLGHMAVSAQLQ